MEIKDVNLSNSKLSSILVGLYAWMVTTWFGAILLDIVYSNIIRSKIGSLAVEAVFAEVSDILLLISFMAILGGVGAIISSWNSRYAKILFIVSLLLVSFEFTFPAVLLRYMPLAQELEFGYLIRLGSSGLATILAFIGLYKVYRN